jgi:hypothetical protein
MLPQMMMMLQSQLLFVTSLLLLGASLVHAVLPLRIYLLVGQSNMEGKGSIQHLGELLLANSNTRSTYQHYGQPGNYTQRDDVHVYFQDEELYQGPLTVGFGSPINEAFGPELEFGWIVGDDYHGGNVLIIKCAWGGKDLAVDFRSPSSGMGNYTYCDNDGSCHPYKPTHYGQYYRKTVETILSVIKNLDAVVPSSNGDMLLQYEVAGLVWFQGWNDVINDSKVAEYGSNLANFICDMRLDLETPNLPVVIGELGQAGPVISVNAGLPHAALRRQMRKVTQQAEFMGNTRYVMTSPYVSGAEDGAERFNGDYHYYGRADTFFYIGRAFGTAMIQLLEDYEPIVKNISSASTHAFGRKGSIAAIA